MKSYIPLETAAIFFLKQGISSECVMVDFTCMGYLGLHARSENRELQNEIFLAIAGLELKTPESQV